MNFLVGLICFILCVMMTIVFGLYEAWLFVDVWEWFIVPLGAVKLSFAHAFGLLVIAGWFISSITARLDSTTHAAMDSDDSAEHVGNVLGQAFGIHVICAMGFTISWATLWVTNSVM